MLLDALLDRDHLADMIGEGFVRARAHPDEPLSILNYTEKAQYAGVWNRTTRTCRGLVVHDLTGQVLARPWPKFFNHGQDEAGALDLAAPVEVTDKVDGSLGILYPLPSTPGTYAVATRGSFESDQARWATARWQVHYADRWTPPPGHTVLFEIVYPANRIVLDYGTREDLVLLGAVHIESGRALGPGDPVCATWPGPRVDVFAFDTLGAALLAAPRPNAEGLVVRSLSESDQAATMIKIKQEDYVALHKLVTGLNARVVWERLGTGESVAQLCESLPDEFHGWVAAVAAGLEAEREEIILAARQEYARVLTELGAPPGAWAPDVDRKAFAAAAVRSPSRAWLFMLLDRKDLAAKVWQWIRPPADFAPRNLPSEDAA